MTEFGLFIVRPPQGVATVAAIHPSRADDARATLKRLRGSGFVIKALSKASVPSNEREAVRVQLQGLINGMFEQAPYRPAVSLVW